LFNIKAPPSGNAVISNVPFDVKEWIVSFPDVVIVPPVAKVDPVR
jgi:hypothetical protein